MLKWGIISTGVSVFPKGGGTSFNTTPTQVEGRSEKGLFATVTGGGQLEIRMSVPSSNSDPDVMEVAQRLKPYNPESWHVEWKRVAEKNEQMAEQFEGEGRHHTANEFYLRAARNYERADRYLPENDSRMVPTYYKMKGTFDKAWQFVQPPFERVEIAYEGKTLRGFFFKPQGAPAGRRFPTAYSYSGAGDSYIETSVARPWSFAPAITTTTRGEWQAFVDRGMAYLAVDGPGQGGALRIDHIYAPPDVERVAKAVFDYLASRTDVDPNRIGIGGTSLGGYYAPRCVTGEKRAKAVWMWSASYSLLDDVFDYYPPIQDNLRWLIGAKDLVDARKKLADYTLEGIANKIECPMLVGYSNDDRIMDPAGALNLYREATRSKREMMDGIGHGRPLFYRDLILADWAAKQLGAEP